MKSKLTAAVIIGILITGCASKSSKSFPSGKESITSLMPGGTLLVGFNRNDDYEIDMTELSQGKESAFKRADLNVDGVINMSEFRYWQPKATGSISALPNLVFFDRNFNDQITQNEFEVGLEKLFHDADKNKDDKVSYEELVIIVASPENGKSKGGGSRGRGSGSRQGRGGGGPPSS